MAKDQTASPGTHLPGPLYIESMDPTIAEYSAVAASVTLAAVAGVDGVGSNAASKVDVDARLATIQTTLNSILERIQ